MNLHLIARAIIRFASTLLARVRTWENRIDRYLDSDRRWILLILILAALLRFPILAHPAETMLDESIYSDFAMLAVQEQPFFDIHPPLARMLFAEIIAHTDYDPSGATITTTPDFTPHAFQDFPYVPLRTTVALFGTLLPLLLYGVARMLDYSPRWSGLIALFVVFDPAFIVYSRAILPDTILLCVEMLALLGALGSLQSRTIWGKVGFALLAALALGAAISMKWIALSMVGVVGLLYLFHRRWKTIVATGMVMAGVYVIVFTSFLFYFPNGGKADPVLLIYHVPYVTELEFPTHPTWNTALRFLPELHQIMWLANTDMETIPYIPDAPTPLSWSVAKISYLGWWSSDYKTSIWLQGNALLWNLAFFLLLFEMGWIATQVRARRVWPIDHTETILLLGYIGSYLPFFFIDRPMFLYHYFLALLFLFLLIPKVAPRAIGCLGMVTNDVLFARVFAGAILVAMLINFLLAFPRTYGF